MRLPVTTYRSGPLPGRSAIPSGDRPTYPSDKGQS